MKAKSKIKIAANYEHIRNPNSLKFIKNFTTDIKTLFILYRICHYVRMSKEIPKRIYKIFNSKGIS